MHRLFVLTCTFFFTQFNICLAEELIGDWLFIKFAKDDCLGVTPSADLKHRHIIYGGNGKMLINVVDGPEVEHLKGSVIYTFDNKTKITHPIYDWGEADRKNELGFAPICVMDSCDEASLIKHMKAGNFFTINKKNGDLIAGPFSLKGSSKVIKLLKQEGKCRG